MFPRIKVLHVVTTEGCLHRNCDRDELWHWSDYIHLNRGWITSTQGWISNTVASMSSWHNVLDADCERGSVLSAEVYICSFQADTANFSHWFRVCPDLLGCSQPSPSSLVKCCWELFSSCVVVLDAVSSFWSEWGFSARSLVCHQLAVAFQGKSLNRLVPPPSRPHLREDNDTCLSHRAAGRFARGPSGKVLQKVNYYCSTVF